MPSESGLSVGLSRIVGIGRRKDAVDRESVRIFTDGQISSAVLDILRNAGKWVILVSPYNKFMSWGHFSIALENAVKQGVKVTMFYREGKRDENIDWLMNQGASVYAVEDLHAKIYMNETQVLITSMNLLEGSAKGSREICISIEEEKLHKDIHDYVEDLSQHAVRVRRINNTTTSEPEVDAPKVVRERRSRYTTGGTGQRTAKTNRGKATSGEAYCVRCGDSIDFNTEKPLCDEHYKSWNKFKNPDYKEKYCHRCGKKKSTTYAEPFCDECNSDYLVSAYCVRCGESIDFDDEKPLCDEHYKSWNKFKNPEYKEKYCHGCGKKKSTTYAKPFCRPCWKEHFG